jgi:hypothetical protein
MEPLLTGAPFVHTADMRLIDNPTARAAADRGLRTNLSLALRKGSSPRWSPSYRTSTFG